jgi:RHS repeat-associated protein
MTMPNGAVMSGISGPGTDNDADLHLPPLPQTGVYTVTLSSTAVNDPIRLWVTRAGVALNAIDGPTRTLMLSRQWQNGIYVFGGETGQVITLTASRANTTGAPVIKLYQPNGAQLGANISWGAGATSLAQAVGALPATGVYTVVLDLNNATTPGAVDVRVSSSGAPRNIAPLGTAYRWSAMTTAIANATRTAATGLNDGNITVDVNLNTAAEAANRWEAAGVVFAATQRVESVAFVNGTWNVGGDLDGTFAQSLTVQYSTNGTAWLTATGWTVSPAYPYTNTAAGVTYTLQGPALDNILGIRVAGQLSIAGHSSNRARIREFYAYAPAQAGASTNLGALGIAQRHYNMAAGNSDATKTAAAGLNDGQTTVNVDLNTADETAGRWEAASLIFTNTQTVGTVKFLNGSFDITSGIVRGVFAANLTLHYTLNGTTWLTATGWTLSPSYSYTNTAGLVEYTFTGTPIANVKGVRVAGQLSNVASDSKRARIREIKAYPNQNAVGRGAGKALYKPAEQVATTWEQLMAALRADAPADGNLGVTKYYEFGGGVVAMRRAGEGLVYLHGDQLGSTSLTTSASGVVLSQVRYKPWGEERWSAGAPGTDRLFTGQRKESPRTGLAYDYVARMYSPITGRFMSADPIIPIPTDPQSYNRYSYVYNRPLIMKDPTGHCGMSGVYPGPWCNQPALARAGFYAAAGTVTAAGYYYYANSQAPARDAAPAIPVVPYYGQEWIREWERKLSEPNPGPQPEPEKSKNKPGEDLLPPGEGGKRTIIWRGFNGKDVFRDNKGNALGGIKISALRPRKLDKTGLSFGDSKESAMRIATTDNAVAFDVTDLVRSGAISVINDGGINGLPEGHVSLIFNVGHEEWVNYYTDIFAKLPEEEKKTSDHLFTRILYEHRVQ